MCRSLLHKHRLLPREPVTSRLAVETHTLPLSQWHGGQGKRVGAEWWSTTELNGLLFPGEGKSHGRRRAGTFLEEEPERTKDIVENDLFWRQVSVSKGHPPILSYLTSERRYGRWACPTCGESYQLASKLTAGWRGNMGYSLRSHSAKILTFFEFILEH